MPLAVVSLALVLALVLVLGAVATSSALASATGLVISEFRFRGPSGTSGASDEFVELRNTSTSSLDISGYKLRGCASGSPGNVSDRATVPQGTVLQPGQHYLFANNSTGGYSGGVTEDQAYSTGVSDLTSSSYSGVRVEDAAGVVTDGVGSPNSPCREGTGLTHPTTVGDQSFERKPAGVNNQDTDDNAADFEGPKAGNPQNSGAAEPACSDGEDNDGDGKTDFEGANPDPGCSAADDDDETDAPQPTVTEIHEIQGSGASSPRTGQTVTIEGVVTGVDDEIGASFGSNNTIRTFPEDAGIFVQEETADADGDASTSEGIFVGYVRDRGDYAIGDVVRVNGEVREKFEQTMISETVNEEPVRVGTAPTPEPVAIDPARAEGQDAGTRPYYESLEGMRVSLATGTANSGGTTKFGELFMTPGTEKDRVFRTETEPALIATDADAGAGDPPNPYRDPDGSTTEVEADLFDTVSNSVGPLGYSFGHYKILVQPGLLPTVADTGVAYPYTGVLPAGEDRFRLASFNVENYFPVGGALDGGTVSQEEFDSKTARLTDAVGDLLERPDVVAVQEVYDLATLRALATSLGGYTAYLEEGRDSRGIDVGFLVKSGVVAENVRQLGRDATEEIAGTNCSDEAGKLFDRPPLAADITTSGGREFTLFSNHFSSKSAPDGCREAQAAFVRDEVERLEAEGRQVIVAGDLNAFEDESALTTLENGQTTLTNQWSRAPEEERYSFAFSGRLQTLDHVLVTDGLDALVRDFRYAHFDNDYHEREDATDGHKVSDHDPPVLTLADEPPDTAAPVVERPRPADGSSTRDRTPTIGARVTDDDPGFARDDIRLYVDGDEVTGFEYDEDSGRLTYTPRRKLSYGGHRVEVVAEDAATNSTAEQWRFRVRR